MSDELGTIAFGSKGGDPFLGRDLGRDRNYSEAIAYSIDKEVKRIMDECHAEAVRLLTENMDKLVLIAETLKERETIQADEFKALMEGRTLEELDKQKEALLEEQKKGDTPAEAEGITVETPVDTLELSAEAQAVLEARQAAEDINEPNKQEEEEK